MVRQDAVSVFISRFHFHPAVQGEDNVFFAVYGDMVDQTAPECFVKVGDNLRQFFNLLYETVKLPLSDAAHGDFCCDLIVLSFAFLCPGAQYFKPDVVFILVLDLPCVFRNGRFDRFIILVHLYGEPLLFNFQFFRPGKGVPNVFQLFQDSTAVGDDLIYHPDESVLDLIFRQMRCFAPGTVLELGIALPDHPPVFIVAVPGLAPVPSTTASAFDPG